LITVPSIASSSWEAPDVNSLASCCRTEPKSGGEAAGSTGARTINDASSGRNGSIIGR
jgi:hypothetical protein